MCGICLYLSSVEEKIDFSCFSKIQHRGPDKTISIQSKVDNFFFNQTFHRLSIIDKSDLGNQPFIYQNGNRTIYLMCNGEIYNYKSLIEEHLKDMITDNKVNGSSRLLSGSDCEVITILYLKYGINKTVDLISNNEFAFTLLDIQDNEFNLYVSRDVAGVRPLFYFRESKLSPGSAINEVLKYGFCSELKGLLGLSKNILAFPPGNIMTITKDKSEIVPYYLYLYKTVDYDINVLYEKIYNTLVNSVREKLISDRPLACLLSGGLDSSIVASIANKYYNGKDRLKTFTIGMKGSTDIKYAEIMSKFLNTDHTTFYCSQEELLKLIPEVIYATETYDITTIRASTPQYLLAKKISETTNVKVVLNGDGSDEITYGYLLFHNAPNSKSAQLESEKLLKEIHKYDVLRVDRSISNFGLEARVPFLSREFIDLYMNINPSLKIPIERNGRRIEKYLLRKSFEDSKLLPNEVLWRQKETFSDGVSPVNKSWFQIIQEFVDTLITNEEFEKENKKYSHNPPHNKESYYYRKIFEQYFGSENDKVIQHMWLNSFSDSKEPSARSLLIYKKDE
jgi:asparagine synthase (glutamine-hydrolysing)